MTQGAPNKGRLLKVKLPLPLALVMMGWIVGVSGVGLLMPSPVPVTLNVPAVPGVTLRLITMVPKHVSGSAQGQLSASVHWTAATVTPSSFDSAMSVLLFSLIYAVMVSS